MPCVIDGMFEACTCINMQQKQMSCIVHLAGQKETVQDVVGPGENEDIGSDADN